MDQGRHRGRGASRRRDSPRRSSALNGFAWTEDHGDWAVLEKDFVETAELRREGRSGVDAVMMSSHGNPNGFSVSNGSVSTSDTIRFGKGDLEIFATHACKLLEHTVEQLGGALDSAPSTASTTCAASTTARTAAAARTRAAHYFAMYAAYLHYLFGIFGQDPVRVAWKKANILVEGSNVRVGLSALPPARPPRARRPTPTTRSSPRASPIDPTHQPRPSGPRVAPADRRWPASQTQLASRIPLDWRQRWL